MDRQHDLRRKRHNAILTVWMTILLAGLAILNHILSRGSNSTTGQLTTIESQVDAVLSASPLIDSHNDFAIWIRAFYHNHIYAPNFTSPPLYGQVDFPRLKEGRLSAQFWSVYVECPKSTNSSTTNTTLFADESVYREVIHDTLQQVDLIRRLAAARPDVLDLVSSSAQVWEGFRSGKGRVSSFLSLEGLHQIGNSASVLRVYHALGVRAAGLTHTCHNLYADSSEAVGAPAGGLSEAGRRIVAEMNRIGIMVDLSHASADAARLALEASKAPVIFSHSAASGVCNHPRNVPDDVLRRLQSNGGVVMVSFYPEHVRCGDPSEAEMDDVVRNVMYIGEMIGYRHVGIGSDFDGMQKGPKGLEDVSRYPALVAELLRRGVGRAELEGVVGANVLRVLGEVESVAEDLQRQGAEVLEDDVKDMFA
ncbi:renal dipeptidase family [Cladorrhinum samala]|uniref:Dipeptidase n=1 Tax=Cladorrhinum samala TaxID=585594 RepID=A0AAV9HXL6_9PEZI|nr:renal dipeptidase family [Cladorrhinum samala]